MLDSRATFDALVHTHARDDEQAERILANRFYRNIAGALSGTQEYMAMEKLHELHDGGGYDMIVVDTPPTRHALDFLDAPARLTRLLDNRIFRVLMAPTRRYLRVASMAVQTFLRTVAKVIGSEVIDDIVAFFRAFEGMEQGFRDRARNVTEVLADQSTAFVLVTSPRRDAVDEAEFFAARLKESHVAVAALVVNRVHPDYGDGLDPDELRRRAKDLAGSDDEAGDRLATRYANLADYVTLARLEREELTRAGERIGAGVVAYVPSLAHDVVDVAALDEVAECLLANVNG
jgi:anion-transporting  ArsA/GET3 family ATPase